MGGPERPGAARLCPVVLAAGLSTRMGGRPKPLLDFDGRTALELVLDACAGLVAPGAAPGLRPIVVLGHEARRVRETVDLSGVVTVLNPEPARGRTSSLRAGLLCLPEEADGFLLFPVDGPLVLPATVRTLAERFEAGPAVDAPGSPLLVIPSLEHRRGHPVVVGRALLAEFLALGDDEPARAVVRRHEARILHVVVDDAGVLLDVDTPEDYARALELYRRRRRSE
ncbi:MAG: nucleotidyltransferase family protein [Planctomycetes bacterium]|nr:nucleotidyltransferase family protein [Planctomycetota bacterium]